MLEDNFDVISEPNFLKTILDNIHDVVILVDERRNIIFHNAKLSDLVNSRQLEGYKGLTIGQALNCAHANEPPAGCGTTKSCALCGFTKSITKVHSINNEDVRILNDIRGEALDLKVSSSPFVYNNKEYIVLVLADIKHEKRRRILERIFFHDVMNTAGGIKGLSELLEDATSIEEIRELSQLIFLASIELVEEIQSQKILAAAESNELIVNKEIINIKFFISNLVNFYASYEIAKDKKLIIDPNLKDIEIENDPFLLRRVVGNMIKNALEEIKPGESINIGYGILGNKIEIWVQNPGYMNKDVQLQIFQRSFSTKGIDRGLGTYSMKMLSERYLNGKISFTSDEINGTRFSLIL